MPYLPLVGVVVGSLLTIAGGWFLSRLADWRKMSSERSNALRAAYAEWYTAASVMRLQIDTLLWQMNDKDDTPDSDPGDKSVRIVEWRGILSTIKDCLNALHKAYLLDHNAERREQHRALTNQAKSVYQFVFHLLTYKRVPVDEAAITKYMQDLQEYKDRLMQKTETTPEKAALIKQLMSDSEVRVVVLLTIKDASLLMDLFEKDADTLMRALVKEFE
ncbi:MAG TPA: hypothetical protein VHR66_11220 [Gemmataceae bacterium]|nr:hypothetical protein [Gemmataceae bacterium]